MAFIIIGGICILMAPASLGIALKRGAPSPVPIAAVATLLSTILTLYGFKIYSTANARYREMVEIKTYIEANWRSEDPITQGEVQTAYWSYTFKLDRIRADSSIFSPYWGLDINKLNLEGVENGE